MTYFHIVASLTEVHGLTALDTTFLQVDLCLLVIPNSSFTQKSNISICIGMPFIHDADIFHSCYGNLNITLLFRGKVVLRV